MPQPRSSLIDDDTGAHDLRPIEMHRLRPALEADADAATGEIRAAYDSDHSPQEQRQAEDRDRRRARGGATSIGPSPFAAKNETRMYDTGRGREKRKQRRGRSRGGGRRAGPAADYNQPEEEAQSQEEEQPEEEAPPDEEADPTSVPTGQHKSLPKAPPRRPTGKTAPAADGKRKGLLIAIAATAVLALVVIIAAAVKFAGGPKSAVFITATPKDVPFSVTINPGQTVSTSRPRRSSSSPASTRSSSSPWPPAT